MRELVSEEKLSHLQRCGEIDLRITAYPLSVFGAILVESGRVNAYAEAITTAVGPGDVVVDIGCGAGLFLLLAGRAGITSRFPTCY